MANSTSKASMWCWIIFGIFLLTAILPDPVPLIDEAIS